MSGAAIKKPDFRRIEGAASRIDEAMAATLAPPAAAARAELDAVMLICATTLDPEPIKWLWSEWLALGKLHIMAGAPGQGKTTINLAFAATVSAGGRWPDGSRCEPGNVLIWSGEDDPTDTLLPRLVAMGANTARVYFVGGARINGESLAFDPARDMAHLIVAAERVGGCRLLIVDPVVSAVTGDSHKNTEVRRALQPLVDLGASLGCAVVGISHFSKGSGGRDPTERVVGSVAFGAVARVVLVAAKVKSDDEGKERRILARSKSNIGPDSGGFDYDIDQIELDAYPGILASRITWGAAVEGSARELLAAADDDAPEDDDEPEHDVDAFLRELLKDGTPVPSKSIRSAAREVNYSWSTVHRASKRIGVRIKKDGMAGGWYWTLTKVSQATEDSEHANVSNVTTSESSTPSLASSALAGDDDVAVE